MIQGAIELYCWWSYSRNRFLLSLWEFSNNLHMFYSWREDAELNAKYSSPLSDRLNILLHGTAPLYFHVVNVCLHCAVTCLLMHTCERCVFEDPRLALVTALLFAVHPVHTEAVSTIKTPSLYNTGQSQQKKHSHMCGLCLVTVVHPLAFI